MDFASSIRSLYRYFLSRIIIKLLLIVFIGLPGYQTQAPYDASMLVWFSKQISMDILNEANEYMLEHKDDGWSGAVGIRYLQDISLLNEARGNREYIICRMCIILWDGTFASLSQECKERLPDIRKKQEAHREKSL